MFRSMERWKVMGSAQNYCSDGGLGLDNTHDLYQSGVFEILSIGINADVPSRYNFFPAYVSHMKKRGEDN